MTEAQILMSKDFNSTAGKLTLPTSSKAPDALDTTAEEYKARKINIPSGMNIGKKSSGYSSRGSYNSSSNRSTSQPSAKQQASQDDRDKITSAIDAMDKDNLNSDTSGMGLFEKISHAYLRSYTKIFDTKDQSELKEQ